MMFTLLKHEFLRTRGLLASIFGIAALVVLLSCLVIALHWQVLAEAFSILAIVALVALPCVVLLAMTADYWASSYRDFGYFTQTIPVRGGRIFWAKLVWMWLVMLVTLLFIAALVLALLYAGSIGAPGNNPIERIVAKLGELFSSTEPVTAVLIVALALLVPLSWPTYFMYSASIGSESPRNRLGAGGPVLVFVALYFATQVLCFIAILAVPFGIGLGENGMLGIVPANYFADMLAGTRELKALPLGLIPVTLLVPVYCIWRTHHSWNHRVSVQ